MNYYYYFLLKRTLLIIYHLFNLVFASERKKSKTKNVIFIGSFYPRESWKFDWYGVNLAKQSYLIIFHHFYINSQVKMNLLSQLSQLIKKKWPSQKSTQGRKWLKIEILEHQRSPSLILAWAWTKKNV